MSSHTVEVYPALVTAAVLDAYAEYLVSRAAATDGEESRDGVVRTSTTQETPQSVEEALAPLEVIYGKTALSAIGIALHGAEPVIRYVEEMTAQDSTDGAGEEVTRNDNNAEEITSDDEVVDTSSALSAAGCKKDDNAKMQPETATSSASLSQQAKQRGRCLYHVGEYTLFSPYYCPCSAYAYQSVQRQEVWCCKHLLALQLVLRVEATGLPQDNLRERIVPAAEFTQLLLKAL